MDKYIELMNDAGMIVYIVIGLSLILFAWWGYKAIKGSSKEKKKIIDLPVEDTYEAVSKEVKEIAETKDTIISKIKLGVGDFKCLCFRRIKGLAVGDFTTIGMPVGEMYQFDPSCPISGNGYIVRENDQNEIVDYDPREVPFIINESPEYAYFAIVWDIVKTVFYVPIQWWKSPSTLFAIILLVIDCIAIMAVLG